MKINRGIDLKLYHKSRKMRLQKSEMESIYPFCSVDPLVVMRVMKEIEDGKESCLY